MKKKKKKLKMYKENLSKNYLIHGKEDQSGREKRKYSYHGEIRAWLYFSGIEGKTVEAYR